MLSVVVAAPKGLEPRGCKRGSRFHRLWATEDVVVSRGHVV